MLFKPNISLFIKTSSVIGVASSFGISHTHATLADKEIESGADDKMFPNNIFLTPNTFETYIAHPVFVSSIS